ncbi:MAG: hypothetical protein AAB885_02260, partial [Patescibacteria group bacterium]
ETGEKKPCIIETRINKFISSPNYRGLRWIAASFKSVIVIEMSPDSEKLEIETSADLKYHLLTKRQ